MVSCGNVDPYLELTVCYVFVITHPVVRPAVKEAADLQHHNNTETVLPNSDDVYTSILNTEVSEATNTNVRTSTSTNVSASPMY